LRFLVQSNWQICDPTEADYVRAADILEQYADSRIDFVDAIIMAIAERLSIQTVFTIDRRDFGIYRPRHCEFLELLP
jgi:predicted nucleic acid-binding protein